MRWPEHLTTREATRLQRELRDQVIAVGGPKAVRRVAGVDVAVGRGRGPASAAAVLLDYPGLQVVERATAERELEFPYVPGLLAFREAPAALAALEALRTRPDLLLVDGHGRAHPRRAGLACTIGVALETPTIGVGKSLLCGQHADLAPEVGSRTAIEDAGQVIGAVLRTRSGVRPVYVSVGHLVGLDAAVEWVLRLSRFRLPEPLRHAHRLAAR